LAVGLRLRAPPRFAAPRIEPGAGRVEGMSDALALVPNGIYHQEATCGERRIGGGKAVRRR